uniref:response regulator transcription factor n=1 Tax=Candidatus Stercorousia sp. TaxID=3048886 RepID=UPI004029310C
MSELTQVLLVDDNSKYLKDALPFYGYEVTVALDGVQALKELANESNKFDIVLLDVMMPNMNGWDTLKAIRKNEKTKHLPVIMLTAVNEDQKMVTGLKIGADDYIVKPFVLPNLLARMEAVLRRSIRQKEISQDVIQSQVPIDLLTSKEKEVLQMVAKGESNKQIADKMFVKEVTVKTHLNSIFKKLKVANRTQAVLLAMQADLVKN